MVHVGFMAGGWNDGHVLEGGFVKTAEVPKHMEFVASGISSMGRSCKCFAWVKVELALVLGRRVVASGIDSRRSVRYVMALGVVGLTNFVRRVRCMRGPGPVRSELFQDAELFGCQRCLVWVDARCCRVGSETLMSPLCLEGGL